MKITINGNTPLTVYDGIITSECFVYFDPFYKYPCYRWVDSTNIVLGMWFSDYFRYIINKEPCEWYFFEGDYHLLIQPDEEDKYSIKCFKDGNVKYTTYLTNKDIISSLDSAIIDFIDVLRTSKIRADKEIKELNIMHNIIIAYLELSNNKYINEV